MVDPKLNSLLKIVETGSYTKAAEALSLSQPAVSQHIKLLEEELGVRLFDRVRGELRLTREGRIAAEYARRVISTYNNLERALKNAKEQVTNLTVGITHTAESNMIVETLAAYGRLYEGMTIKVITDSNDNLYARLRNEEIDFALVEGRIDDPSLHFLLLDTDSIVLAVSPNHPLSGRTKVTVDDLKKEKLILRLPDSNTRNLFRAALESHNLRIEDFNVIMEIDNIATIKDLIRRDFGVSVLAKSACMDEYRKGKLKILSIENLSMTRETCIVYSASFDHPELLREIAEKYQEMRV